MSMYSRRLSQFNQYYLCKILKNYDLPDFEIKGTFDIATVIEAYLNKLNASQFAELEQYLLLHQNLGRQSLPFAEDLKQVETKLLTLLKVPYQPPNSTSPDLDHNGLTCQIPLGEMLIKRKLITSRQLQEALVEQSKTNKRLGEILIKRKLITFNQLDDLLWEQVNSRDTGKS